MMVMWRMPCIKILIKTFFENYKYVVPAHNVFRRPTISHTAVNILSHRFTEGQQTVRMVLHLNFKNMSGKFCTSEQNRPKNEN